MRLLLLFCLLIAFGANASSYVVIGAFAREDNAIKLSKREKAEYEINPIKQLFYVYVLKTEDHEQALGEARRLQRESRYKDAWVFSGTLGENGKGEDIIVKPEPIVVEQPKTEQPVEPKEEPPTAPAVNSAYEKTFFFNVVYSSSGSKADGAEVTVIEPKSQRKEYVVKGNENVVIKPINQSGDIRLECDLVGYRKIIQTINFKSPDTTEGVSIVDNRIIVPFNLVRLKKGDHTILYNVFFYKDAAIMRPESQFDLDGLLAMMQDNPRYKIRIHGHTNGGAAGKILEVGESGDFFSLNGAKEGGGSAKKLSLKRAETIRNYLVKQGVEPTRMVTKAWGGKKPIYDKMHTQAAANVRVEVEVLEE